MKTEEKKTVNYVPTLGFKDGFWHLSVEGYMTHFTMLVKKVETSWEYTWIVWHGEGDELLSLEIDITKSSPLYNVYRNNRQVVTLDQAQKLGWDVTNDMVVAMTKRWIALNELVDFYG